MSRCIQRRGRGANSRRAQVAKTSNPLGSVVDLFCGAGGLSYGFKEESFPVVAGIDSDDACRFPFEKNIGASFIHSDVTKVSAKHINDLFQSGKARILVGCAPCQPFSSHNRKRGDEKWRLLGTFSQLIKRVLPDIVSMENVPRLVSFRNGVVFNDFVASLEANGYHVDWDTLYGPDFGLAQTRKRLVLLASRLGPIELPQQTHNGKHPVVQDVIGELPSIRDGEAAISDRLHCARKLSRINMRRIIKSKPGGSWHDWPLSLRTACHRKKTGKRYYNVYGRMRWDEPAPTITTQFSVFGTGRFGHPEQQRALSLREGALLQGFPAEYEFLAPDQPVRLGAVSRLIGNAVPVTIATAIAKAVGTHLRKVC